MASRKKVANQNLDSSKPGSPDAYFGPKKAASVTNPSANEPNLVSSPPLKRKRANNNATSPTSLLRENASEGKRRRSKGYAPPSTYSHLPPLPDTITPHLLCVFVGLNPGIQTATKGHPYAHPSNHYWSLLHASGLTPDRRLAPSEYITLPERYSLGNTNIVSRASRDGSELSKEEMVTGAGVLDEKIKKWKPEVVCLVGKSIWEAVWKWKHGRGIRKDEFKYGFQNASEKMGRKKGSGSFFRGVKEKEGKEMTEHDSLGEEGWDGARVFVATSTSGLAATLSMSRKEEIWAELGGWVKRRREEREAAAVP